MVKLKRQERENGEGMMKKETEKGEKLGREKKIKDRERERYEIGNKSVSLCLFKPCCCFFMCTISEINLL